MNKSRVVITVLPLLALPVLGGVGLGFIGLIFGLFAACLMGWLLNCLLVIRVNQVAVIQSRFTGRITRLEGEGIGLVMYPFESLLTILPTLPVTEEGTLENVRSAEGVALTLRWRVCYQPAPFAIAADDYNLHLHNLIWAKSTILRNNVDTCFRTVMGRKSTRLLCAGMQVESTAREAREMLQRTLLSAGFSIQRIWIGEITAPADYERSLVQASERQIDLEAQQKNFLAFLKSADGLLPEDREWLLNLEQLWVMKNAAVPPLVYPPLRPSVQPRSILDAEGFRSLADR